MTDHESPDPSRATRWRPVPVARLALVAVAALLIGGCGDDDGDDRSHAELLEADLTQLGDVASDLVVSPAGQVASSPPVGDLFSCFGFPLAGIGRSAGMPLDFRAFTGAASGPGQVGAARRDIPFGTYERDIESTAEPCPGWVYVAATPSDGLVFIFSEDDDFVIIEGGVERHISGEIRFLNMTFATVGSEDILTSVLWEIQIDPGPSPVLRVPFRATVDDVSGEYERVEFGDVDQPNNLSNCYLGPLAFDFLHDETTNDIRTKLIAIDTTPNPDYVLVLDVEQVNVVDEIPEEVNLLFGFGHSATVTNPRTVIVASLTNIEVDPGSEDLIADVTGSVTRFGRTLATFAGSTTEVPVEVDIDGDGDIDADDTCIDIDITFTDSGQTMNVCEAFSGVIMELPLGSRNAAGLRCGPLRF